MSVRLIRILSFIVATLAMGVQVYWISQMDNLWYVAVFAFLMGTNFRNWLGLLFDIILDS